MISPAAAVRTLRLGTSHASFVRSRTSLLEKCIYSKSLLTPTSYGPLLEEHVRQELGLQRSSVGDGTLNGHTVEIKVSLSDHRGRVNFVQIRPHQPVSHYLLIAWDMSDQDPLGRLWSFFLTPQEMELLVVRYGHYAHGSRNELGTITQDTLASGQREFALRPCTTAAPQSKCRQLWDQLTAAYSLELPSVLRRLQPPTGGPPPTPPPSEPQSSPPPPRSDPST